MAQDRIVFERFADYWNKGAVGLEWIPMLSLVERAATLAADTGHTVYDCAYLVACAERGAWIATADERMRGAAERMRLKVWRPVN